MGFEVRPIKPHYTFKLTYEQVEIILSQQDDVKTLAKRYCVTQQTIYNVINKTTQYEAVLKNETPPREKQS